MAYNDVSDVIESCILADMSLRKCDPEAKQKTSGIVSNEVTGQYLHS